MDTVIELTNTFGTKYEKHRNDNLVCEVQIVSLQHVVNEYEYMLLLNSNGKVITEAYDYLNFHIENYSYKKRELALSALKVWFSFIELFGIEDYRSLERKDLPKFITFLKGGHSKGASISLNFKTCRANKTINMYLAVYRDFFKFLHVEDSVLYERSIYNTYNPKDTFLAHAGKVTQSKYTSSLPEVTEKRIPKYIKFREYKAIINFINSQNSKFKLRNKLIINLMYEHGLRISEVLGLTTEDLDFKFSTSEKTDIKLGRIILRNRVSDKQYHHCKNLHIPSSISEYTSPDYQVKGYGYNYVIVPLETLNLIQEYIDSTMDPFNISEIALKRLDKRTADIVNPALSKSNYYIFISKDYKPLTISGWNKTLRNIFEHVGIPIDSDVKSNNLSHRFRHGFAMYLKALGFQPLDIMRKLRHSKVASVSIYFNPDIEDDIDLAKEVISKSRAYLDIDL